MSARVTTFAEYAAAALRTRLPSTMEPPGVYPALLLASETKELGDADRLDASHALYELSDILWAAIVWAYDRDIVPDGALRRAHSWQPGDWRGPLRVLRSFAGDIADFEQRMMRDGSVAVASRPTAAWIFALFQAADAVAQCLGSNVQEVAELNIAKLAGRAERGTIGGAGER